MSKKFALNSILRYKMGMHFSKIILISGMVGLGSILSGAAVDPAQLPPASPQKGLTFEKDVRPIFDASCVHCHGEVKPKQGLRLDNLTGILNGSKHGKVVIPGQSEKSLIVMAVARLDAEKAMPPNPKPAKQNAPGASAKPTPKPLTAEQVGIIRGWIDQGAK